MKWRGDVAEYLRVVALELSGVDPLQQDEEGAYVDISAPSYQVAVLTDSIRREAAEDEGCH